MFVITGIDYGGADIQLLNLSSEMRRLGHECHVISMIAVSKLSYEFIKNDVQITSLGMNRGRVP
ncbi:MAG: hypothetical protein QS721_08635 [Candidatus Endonucleobacter sp. (ex Gigantidas childressi)]|nr:hypothetical protein [Candidatus Endonucleobacter sp. (ex Gigantidas childressi)]